MASLSSLRSALAAALGGIADLQVSAEALARPSPPAALVLPGNPVVEWDTTMGRGLDRWRFVVEVMVPSGSDVAAQRALDALLASSGARSIKQALEADRTLGGVCDTLHVREVDGYGSYSLADGSPVVGCRVHVDVYAVG